MKKSRVRDLFLGEVSLVDRGANVGSVHLLHKRNGADAATKHWYDGILAAMQKALGSFPTRPVASADQAKLAQTLDEFRESMIAKTDAASGVATGSEGDVVADQVKKLSEYSDEELTKEAARRQQAATAAAGTKDNDDDCDDEMTKRAEAVRKADLERIAKVEADNVDLRKRLAAEEDRREMAELQVVAKAMIGDLTADPTKVAPILKKLSAEERTHLGEVLKSANAVAKDAAFFKSYGTADVDPTSAQAEVEKRAGELRKSDPKLTDEQAVEKAYKEDPSLYERVLQETGGK